MKAVKVFLVSLVVVTLFAIPAARVDALEAFPVVTDPNNSGGIVFGGAPNLFADAPAFFVDDTGNFMNNDFVVYTLDGTANFQGGGFTVSISNGENGIDTTFDGPTNMDQNDDVQNTAPVNAAVATVNAGGLNDGKLNDGNAFRFSAWFRLDPNDSASTNALAMAPQVEPVLKLEFWKEALSEFADNNPGQLQPLFGDKVFDQDQHGGPGGLNIPDMQQAQWIDIDNNGSVIDGDAAAEGRLSVLSRDEWRLVEVTYTINDDQATGDWIGIADDYYPSAAIEEVRATMFWGDFLGNTDLSGAGSFWVDNLLLEVFETEADLLSTPNPNPMPIETAGVPGDFNEDGVVNAADYTLVIDMFGDEVSLPNDNGIGSPVGQAHLDLFNNNFGNSGIGSGSSTAIPEPSAFALVLLALSALIGRRSSR